MTNRGQAAVVPLSEGAQHVTLAGSRHEWGDGYKIIGQNNYARRTWKWPSGSEGKLSTAGYLRPIFPLK